MLKKRFVFTLVTFMVFGLFGCTPLGETTQISSLPSHTKTQDITNIPLPSLTPTQTPSATSSPTPTPTSSPTPTPTPTPLIKPGNAVITTDNVDRIIQLGQIGKGHINDVAWSADGTKIVLGTGIGVYIYDSETLEQELFIQTEKSITSIDISPDNQRLITGDWNGIVDFWDVSTGQKIDTLYNWMYAEEGCFVAFSPDGSFIASIGMEEYGNYYAVFWNATTYEESHRIFLGDHYTGIEYFTFSNDSQVIAVGGTQWIMSRETNRLNESRKTIYIWDVNEKILLQTLTDVSKERNWILCAGFFQDASTLWVAYSDNTITYWNLNEEIIVNKIKPKVTESAKSFSPDGNQMMSICDRGTYCIYDVNSWSVIKKLTGHFSKVSSLSMLPDGNSFTAMYNKYWQPSNITIFDISTGFETRNIDSPFHETRSMAISTDGQIMAVSDFNDDNYVIHLINTRTGQELHNLESHKRGVYTMAFSPNGGLLASGGWDNNTLLWDVKTGILLHTFYGNDTVFDLAFSKDGHKLAVSGRKNVIILDTTWGTKQQELTGYYKQIFSYSVAFSPDGELLASGGSLGAIDLFHVPSGNRINYLEGHTSEISSLAFSPAGDLLASASKDNTIRLWDVSSGDELAVIDEHGDHVSSVLFSADGHWLISGSQDGTIRFWGIP
jgi:WD40 repeat protein